MEAVRIHEKNYNIVLYLDNDKFFGYKFNKDNTIEKIDNNVFKYFNVLTCSNNYSILPNENEYKVVLDNETKFKHYYKDGKEDIEMFFKNNGKELISYQQSNATKAIRNISKAFIIGSTTICLSLGAYHLVELHANKPSNVNINKQEVSVENNIAIDELTHDQLIARVANNDITYEDVKSLIYGSNGLSDEEKEFLCNEDYIKDVLEIINESNLVKYDLLSSLQGINIKSYNDYESNVYGYYNPSTPNTIYIKNYNGLTNKTKDTISHESVHMYQYHYCDYEILKEACAEIASEEYFDVYGINAYNDQIIAVKKLMEIIGPKPVFYYTYTGDFSLIDKEVRPYLSDLEYGQFINSLNYDYNNDNVNNSKLKKLNELIAIMYKNKFNKDIKDDVVMNLLNENNQTLVRYYSNERKITPDNSYYLDKENITTLNMTLNAAIMGEYVIAEEEVKEYVSSDKVYEYLKEHNNKGLIRHCTYVDGFKEEKASYKADGVKVSGYLNNEYIKDASEDDLIKKGIILDCEYYFVKDKKRLSSEEYFNNEYDKNNQINYIQNNLKCYKIVANNGEDIEIYVSPTVYLPTVNERLDNTKIK